MEQNPVGSINFDANALYLEEESENELDDKQQDNEVSDIFNIKIRLKHLGYLNYDFLFKNRKIILSTVFTYLKLFS